MESGLLENMDFTRACETLTLIPSGPWTDESKDVNHCAHGARFRLDEDISPLFPYINAVADRARYNDKPVFIRFVFEKRLCVLSCREGAFAPVENRTEAFIFLTKLLKFLTEISSRRLSIIPNHKKFSPSSALDIYRLLPGSNCRECGHGSCMAFAAALSRQQTSIYNCPHLTRPMEEKATFPVYDRHGNIVKTVSIDVDSDLLQQQISVNETKIQELLSRLSSLEPRQNADLDAANSALPAPLTARELEVLRLIALGATNREISIDLQISPHTVKSHVIHIFNKIGVNRRPQASAWGALHGLFQQEEGNT